MSMTIYPPLNPLHCYNPCKHWRFPLFGVLHRCYKPATRCYNPSNRGMKDGDTKGSTKFWDIRLRARLPPSHEATARQDGATRRLPIKLCKADACTFLSP